MMEAGKMTDKDYNYPLVQFYQYESSASLSAADSKKAIMAVEYAVREWGIP